MTIKARARTEIQGAAGVSVLVSWAAKLCELVGRYEEHAASIFRSEVTSLHEVTAQKTNIDSFTPVRTLDMKLLSSRC
jgi:hypothetical protein